MFYVYSIEVIKTDGSSHMIKEGPYYGDYVDEVVATDRAIKERLKPDVVTTQIHTMREM